MLRSLPDSPDNVFVHIFKGMLLLIKEQIGSLMQSLLHMLRSLSLSPPSKTSVNSLKIQELFFVTQALESYRRKEDILREFLLRSLGPCTGSSVCITITALRTKANCM